MHQFDHDNLNNEEIDLVRTLKEANTKTSQIKRMLCARTNKRMSTQRVKNLIAKLVTETSTHADALKKCLESLDSHGGTVKFTYDGEGCVDSLWNITHSPSRWTRHLILKKANINWLLFAT